MNVIIRESAYEDLERIFAWIAKDSPANARSVIDRVLTSIERLALFPGLGHRSRVDGLLEWVVVGLPYIVVYRVEPDLDELVVLAIFHGAQDR